MSKPWPPPRTQPEHEYLLEVLDTEHHEVLRTRTLGTVHEHAAALGQLYPARWIRARLLDAEGTPLPLYDEERQAVLGLVCLLEPGQALALAEQGEAVNLPGDGQEGLFA